MNGTDRLIIKLLERADIENARLLHNDDSVLANLTDPRHVTEAQQQKWFDSVSNSSTSQRYSIHLRETGEFIGLFRIDQIDHVNRNACIGMDIVAEHRGRGYAKEAYDYFFCVFFVQRGFERLWLLVLETNERAINLYTKLGFFKEGRQRNAVWRYGAFFDCLMMSILRKDYEARITNSR